MTKEEFDIKIEECASAYALGTVVDPSDHMDAVNVIKEDYLAGARDAYELLENE